MANRTHTPQLPVANYSRAIARALAWLGDRYLLASPINAPSKHQRPAAKASHVEVNQTQTSFD
jgi:hypothetical protein